MTSDPVGDLLKGPKRRFEYFKGTTVPMPTNFPPGVLGIVAGDLARYSEFNVSLCGVVHIWPPGSNMHYARSVDVSGNCNAIIRAFYDGNPDADWVWVLGDDHTFEQGLLLRMLGLMYEHNLDVLVPHVLKRTPSWFPVVYSHQDENGHYVVADLPKGGLVQVHAAGSAGMLIRRRVLDAIGDPWFRPAPDAEGLNEDLYFCQRVREEGFRIHCAPDLPMGHIAIHSVRPSWHEELQEWYIAVVFDEDNVFPIKSAVREALERDAAVSDDVVKIPA